MKVLKHREEKGYTLWQMSTYGKEKRPAGCPPFFEPYYRVGGGSFITWLNPEDLEEVEFPQNRKEGFAAITDDDDPKFFPCMYNPYARWNGWGCPHFTKEILEQVAKEFDMHYYDSRMVDGTDQVVHYYYGDERPEEFNDGEEMAAVYEINNMFAPDGWTWTCFTPAEKSEWDESRKEEEELV